MIEWNDFFQKLIIQKELEKVSQFREKSLADEPSFEIYPKEEDVFKAFQLTSLKETKVVIIGQDCYHGSVNNIPQAQGLCFSVPDNFPLPPSLKNIFKPKMYKTNAETGSDDISPHTDTSVLFALQQSITLEIALSTAG